MTAWSRSLRSHARAVARGLVAAMVVCSVFWPALSRAQPEPVRAVLASVQGEVVVTQAGGAAQLGSVGLPVGAGDRVAIPRSGRATIRALDGSELLLYPTTTIDIEDIGRGDAGILQWTVTQSRGVTAAHAASGLSAEMRVRGGSGVAAALLRRGGMVVRTDEGTNNVTVGCEDRASRVFFPYEDLAVPCDQAMMRTFTSDGDILDRAVERDVPILVAVFDGDHLGRSSRTTATIAHVDHEEKESVARGGPEGAQAGPPPAAGLPPGPPPPPPNDRFASAIALGVPGSATADTRGATTESGEPQPTCGAVGKTIWYTLTSATPRSVTITTAGSTYDTILAVYTGSSLATLSQVACNDQDPSLTPPPGTSKLSLTLTPGQDYFVQVGGVPGVGGTLVVTVN
jgi:hypothetical protein